MNTRRLLSACAIVSVGCSSLSRGSLEKLPALSEPTVVESMLGSQRAEKLRLRFPEETDSAGCRSSREILDLFLATISSSHVTFSVTCLTAPKIVNASAVTGNRLFIWSGLFEFTRSKEELATILAHELSHLLAGHLKKDNLGEVLSDGFGFGKSQETRVAHSDEEDELGRLRSSNQTVTDREFEADAMGLMLLARAGFDPRTAVNVWRRILAGESSKAQAEFSKSHPGADQRLHRLEALLPRAIEEFQPTGVVFSQGGEHN